MMKRVCIFLLAVFFAVAGNAQSTRQCIVSQDGTGDYTTVQQALDAVPLNNATPVRIFIRKGIYREKLQLASTKNLVTLVGEDKDETILTYDDHSGKIDPSGDTINTMTSQSFYIRADDFTAINLSFRNNAGLTAGQAVALRVEGDRARFINCHILGFQDTLFTSNENSRQYYKDCFIEGSTDFIFGSSTVLFEECHINSKKNSHVTAASTPKEHAYGYVFKKCRLTADTGIAKVSLGRPWRPYASVTYMECIIGNHIIPEGWDNWRNAANENTARYSEYKNAGPGADIGKRAAWSRQLTAKEAEAFTTTNILRGWQPDSK